MREDRSQRVAAKHRDLLDTLAAFRQQTARLLRERGARRRIVCRGNERHGESEAEISEPNDRCAKSLGARTGTRLRERDKRLARTDKRCLGVHDARLQLREIERARRGSRRQRKILRGHAARGSEQSSHGARLLQHVEERELAAREIGRTGVLDAPLHPRGRAQPQSLSEIDDARFDVARRRFGRQRTAGCRHAVNDVQRCKRELAQFQRPRLEHGAAVADAFERAAHVGEIAEHLGCPRVERGSARAIGDAPLATPPAGAGGRSTAAGRDA